MTRTLSIRFGRSDEEDQIGRLLLDQEYKRAKRGSMDRCPVCHDWTFAFEKHICDPVWHVSLSGDEDDWQQLRAKDSKEAAENFAAITSEFGYREGNITVYVRDVTEEHQWAYDVECELIPEFTARKVSEGPSLKDQDILEKQASEGEHDE